MNTSRFDSLDILRGFALLGLPFLNIAAFSMPFAAYLNPYAFEAHSQLNHVVFSFLQIVGVQKFYGIFCILFGASFVLLLDKFADSDKSPTSFMFKRLIWLLIFGLAHLLLLWYGDILSTYAVVGLLIFWLRGFSIKVLSIVWATLIVAMIWFGYQPDATSIDLNSSEFAMIKNYYAPSAEQVSVFIEALRGDYVSVMEATSWAEESDSYTTGSAIFLNSSFSTVLKIVSMMVLGMLLFKTGVLQMKRSIGFYKALAFVGIALGFVSTFAIDQYLYTVNFSAQAYFHFGEVTHAIASYITCLGYIGLVGVIYKQQLLPKFFDYLAHVGRLAFTNYIMQSIIFALIFYGYGIGLTGHLNRLELTFVAMAVAVFQLFLSTWWLTRFKQGPLEWLWRSLVDWKLHDFRR